jgi:transcriptional regulator with XRE-family HTH domain
LAKRVRSLREDRGFSRAKLVDRVRRRMRAGGEAVEFSESTLQKIEDAIVKNPSIGTMLAIAVGLDVTLDEIVQEEQVPAIELEFREMMAGLPKHQQEAILQFVKSYVGAAQS